MRRIFAFRSHYQIIKTFLQKYERWLMPATLVFGFVVDYVTFINIQINTALTILFVHFFVCAYAIAFTYAYDAGKISSKLRYVRLFAPFLVQFNFGGMLSNAFIFYWFSGSLWVSWPFILLFVALMVANDTLRHYYVRSTVQISVFFFATFTIVSVSLPFIFNSISPLFFLLSGVLALGFISGFVWLLGRIAGGGKISRQSLSISIVAIFLITNLFYFANLIPPVPLAIRETGIYHSVEIRGGQYILRVERESFWEKMLPKKTIHLEAGRPAFVFSAIYAPKALNTAIFHEWQYYDEIKSEWVQKDRLSFNLIGGRREGFRGYSQKSTLPLGSWRVFIKTQRGQILGRVRFDITRPTTEVELFEIVK